jgi:hypothetical protein
MPSVPVIADRGEFIDVLKLMRKGRLLVRSDQHRCLIDGFEIVHAFETLSAYGLLDELPPPAGAGVHAPHLHWYRLSPRGRDFAERACAEWRARPLWQRLLLRIVG